LAEDYESEQKIKRAKFLLWAIIGTAIIFSLPIGDSSQISNFSLLISVLGISIFNGYAYLVLRLPKRDVCIIVSCGVAAALIPIIIRGIVITSLAS